MTVNDVTGNAGKANAGTASALVVIDAATAPGVGAAEAARIGHAIGARSAGGRSSRHREGISLAGSGRRSNG